MIISDLHKVFKKNGRPFAAVNNLSFGVLPTECFGLLGLNGAGKTTTIEILTGELDATSGLAFVNGHNIKTDKLKAIRSLGFCPQFVKFFSFLILKFKTKHFQFFSQIGIFTRISYCEANLRAFC